LTGKFVIMEYYHRYDTMRSARLGIPSKTCQDHNPWGIIRLSH
jgi:hypothetical protein